MPTPSHTLSAKEKKHLRKLGHSLHPVVLIGNLGMKTSIIDATKEALLTHELIKVKASTGERDERAKIFEKLAAKTESQLVASIGFTALMYKKHPDSPKISLD